MLDIDPTIRDQAYEFFVQEAQEFLAVLEAGILELRQSRDVPKVYALMRAAHSLKGGAAGVGLPSIKAIAHDLETVFRAFYHEHNEIDLELEELLLQAFDCLKSLILQEVQTGSHDGQAGLEAAAPIFAALNTKLGDALHAEHELPSAAELGIDIVHEVFSGDVNKALTRLEHILSDPDTQEVTGEIRAQAEVFYGVGELVNLPGFVAIARATLDALIFQPEQALEIGNVALVDFRNAQAAVLAGDRTQGGSPSADLLELAKSEQGSSELEDLFQDLESEISEASVLPNLDSLDDLLNDGSSSEINLDSFIQDTVEEASSKKKELDVAAYVKPTEEKSSAKTVRSQPTSTVKVDLNRLEAINNLIGELVTQESSSILQSQQIQGVIQVVLRHLDQFEQVTKSLQDLTDQSRGAGAKLIENSGNQLGFDSLQMESYNRLAMITQEAVEEVAQFTEAMRDMTLLTQQTQQTHRQKQRTLKQVRNQLLRARMFPVGDILQRFPRMIRDLSAQYGKQVTVKLSGTNTLVDKAVLEKLFDPLVHLVRNGFDHGIEMPDERKRNGKAPEATLEVRAFYRGNQTYIEVRDDGRGINLDRVRNKAIALGLVSEDVAALLPKERLYEFLFSAGFSTAAQVSELSGRGVGLDVVMAQVKSLKGSLTLTSEPGKGSIFTMRFPLTLTIADLLIFTIDTNLFAIPVDSLVAIVTAPNEQIQWQAGELVYLWQDQPIPVYSKERLSQHYPLTYSKDSNRPGIPLPQNGQLPLILISGENSLMALPVDQIHQQQELVIKPFGAIVTPPPFLSGCTILGDGSLVPVLDGQALVTYHSEGSAAAKSELTDIEKMLRKTPRVSTEPTILVIDDSLTARQALAATLKKAGYQVTLAQDGRDALTHLQQGANIQAVFCDVEMPRMNGFEFLTHCRREFAQTMPPVIMLTSRSGQKHRQIAQSLGAKAYLTKPYQDSMLLGILQAVLQE